jgi:hypothetical protein
VAVLVGWLVVILCVSAARGGDGHGAAATQPTVHSLRAQQQAKKDAVSLGDLPLLLSLLVLFN